MNTPQEFALVPLPTSITLAKCLARGRVPNQPNTHQPPLQNPTSAQVCTAGLRSVNDCRRGFPLQETLTRAMCGQTLRARTESPNLRWRERNVGDD